MIIKANRGFEVVFVDDSKTVSLDVIAWNIFGGSNPPNPITVFGPTLRKHFIHPPCDKPVDPEGRQVFEDRTKAIDWLYSV